MSKVRGRKPVRARGGHTTPFVANTEDPQLVRLMMADVYAIRMFRQGSRHPPHKGLCMICHEITNLDRGVCKDCRRRVWPQRKDRK